MRRVYLDHNSTTPLDPDVAEAMIGALRDLDGNPSSIHREGQRARAAVERARRQVADLIGASFTEVVFTSGASEANNLAIATLRHRGDGALMTTCVEHPSILAPVERSGAPVVQLGVGADGALELSIDQIVALGRERGVQGLTVMLANNETGNVYPIAALAKAARAEGWWTHCDATQAPGKLELDVGVLGVDMLSLSAHKLYGPKGVGALYVRNGFELAPVVIGGHQERGRRGGTENVAAIVGFGRAAELAQARWADDAAHMARLRDRLWEGVQAADGDSATRQGTPSACLPNTLNVRFDRVDGETLLMNLDLDGVAVSAGSACTAGSLEPSHVILAMGVPPDEARGSVRFSLGRTTTEADIDLVIERLPGILERTRAGGWF